MNQIKTLSEDMKSFVNAPYEEVVQKIQDAIKNQWYAIKYMADPRGGARVPFYFLKRITVRWILFGGRK
ncbi:MAG: hypothetical protein WC455_23465 [Dehalococcoidia bacterium]|jgi:NADPH-dependent 7-cyano-7-deazaguanine reductase QueF